MFRKITAFFIAVCLFALMGAPAWAQAAETLPDADLESVSWDDIDGPGIPGTEEGVLSGKNGWIRLSVSDGDTGRPLSGASFKIFHALDGTEIGKMTTGGDGTAQISLAPGGYYLLEECAPEGYQLSEEGHHVTVTAGETVDVLATDRLAEGSRSETGIIRITKTDAESSDKRLPGAVFSVYDAGDKNAGELMTGEDGTASLELSAGSYTIKETAAPKGYILSDETIHISLLAGGVEELSVAGHKEKETEERSGVLRITKRDTDSGKRLKDAVFGIYGTGTGDCMGKVTTDRKGVAEIGLDPGRYHLLELEAPAGYRLEEEKISFTIRSGQTTEKTVKNKKEETEGLEENEGEKVEKEKENDGTSGEAAQAAPSSLDSAAPSAPSSEKNEGRAERDDDSKKTGILKVINCASGTGEGLSGQTLEVYSSEGKKAGELTVRDGKGTLSLPEGDHYLREKKPPVGFYGEKARIRFSITEGQTTVVEINSERDLADTDPQDIIPKTGDAYPMIPLGLSVFFFLAAAMCGAFLWCTE